MEKLLNQFIDSKNTESLPISFCINEKVYHGIPNSFNPTVTKRRIDSNLSEIIINGLDHDTGLSITVEITQYCDFPVIEWMAWFTNKGNAATPIISNILAIDTNVTDYFNLNDDIKLWSCNGDFASKDGYEPLETILVTNKTLAFAPVGGRPCDQAFPYFRLSNKNNGLTYAVGWPGQWFAAFKKTDTGIRLTAGQEKTNLKLLPDETIRTPRITIMSWAGDDTYAINLWRRWYIAHILPKPNGKAIPPLSAHCGPGDLVEFTGADENNQLKNIESAKKKDIDFDLWWIDAGWYPCYNENHERFWPQTGTWIPDPERFPRGFMPISKKLEEYNSSLLVWFEPERVLTRTQLSIEHDNWMLKVKEDFNITPDNIPEGKVCDFLLNLGNEECRHWLTDHICNIIKENGIKIYRQDFNFEPLQRWRDNDAEDRQGINENFHVQGYLKYWDELLERNPGLWIDSCASGGRRNDLETMRRSVPLHYSDYGYGNVPVKLAFQHTLMQWIPYFKESTLSYDQLKPGDDSRYEHYTDKFAYYCGIGPMIFNTSDIRCDDYDYEAMKKYHKIWERAAATMTYGDFYPLTQFSKEDTKWVVRQFEFLQDKTGFIQGVRYKSCEDKSIIVYPHCEIDDSVYIFENSDTGEILNISSYELRNCGFTFQLQKRSSEIWFYTIQ
jgi:alpha-galactosidase